jgi:diadenosine tetraphosphate (Ap4A) HIT family hydrolase
VNATIQKFGYPETLIQEYQRWVVLLRPQQVTLGSLVLACKEPVRQFAEVSPAGFAELKQAVGDLEATLSLAFKFDKLNYLMLMMVDPDVHFHVIPRYAEPRDFEGQTFSDQSWPGPPALNQFTATDAVTNGRLRDTIRSSWVSH